MRHSAKRSSANFASIWHRLGKGDVAYFHYCGHGARSPAAPEFLEYDLTTKDEGLVCFDSREPGHFDLADKELARLIDELAAREAHVVVSLDCCHSGTATRSFDGLSNAGARAAPGATYPPRPIETYIDGYYADFKRAGKPLASPRGRHMLLAACDRRQLAKEDLADHRGIFTTRFFDVLRHAPDGISYADLFVNYGEITVTVH
ncbi:MAG: caspase family protein [Sphingopyxis sp.]